MDTVTSAHQPLAGLREDLINLLGGIGITGVIGILKVRLRGGIVTLHENRGRDKCVASIKRTFKTQKMC